MKKKAPGKGLNNPPQVGGGQNFYIFIPATVKSLICLPQKLFCCFVQGACKHIETISAKIQTYFWKKICLKIDVWVFFSV